MKRVSIAFIFLILAEILLLFIGCLGGKENPSEPSVYKDSVPGQLSGPTGKVEVANTPMLWGFYQVIYDSSRGVIEAKPLRGPALTLNVVNFLQPPQGSLANMLISVLDDSAFYTKGRMDIRVILKHPFPSQPTYTGFDVCGVFLTEGSFSSAADSGLTYADPSVDPTMLNPDGYTRWMNPKEFLTGNIFGYEPGWWGTSESSENSGFLAGATLNPYKYFAQGLSPSSSISSWLKNQASITNRGMFPAGATCSRDYELLFPIVNNKLVFIFNYAVIANWAPPLVDPPVNPITDFPITANARYPLHIIGTDNSQAYYTPEDAGGYLQFKVNIFDWDAVLGGSTVPQQVSKFMVWSDEPLVPGGFVKIMSEEVEWNSGFTASTSVATIDIPGAVPERDGDMHVWIAVESSNPSSYDQSLNAKVPDDPIASYIMLPVNVKNCPKAFIKGMSSNIFATGSVLDDIEIEGDNFHYGDQFSVYLAPYESSGGSGTPQGQKIFATDIKFINETKITADFNLKNVSVGEYGFGCVNGCGVETTPKENEKWLDKPVLVTTPPPVNVKLTTNRISATPSTVSSLVLSWDPVQGSPTYNIYVSTWNINGSATYFGCIGSIPHTQYTFNLPALQLSGGGKLETWITSSVMLSNIKIESLPSKRAVFYYQNFEISQGQWSFMEESPSYVRFIRSTVGPPFSGLWGAKNTGAVPSSPSVWAALVSPAIAEVPGATNVFYEIVHRHREIKPSNGYQFGWCNTLPANNSPTFTGYTPFTSVACGYQYNDSVSTALQKEFEVSSTQSMNFSTDGGSYIGWYTSVFNASVINGDNKPSYLVMALAGDYGNNNLDVQVDEIAIVIY